MVESSAHPGAEEYADTWVVMPTYNEAENLEGITRAVLDRLPGATVLVVDDASPDGTGELADRLAATESRVRVHHRSGKQGLGKAYIDGYAVALAHGARRIAQLDADWSHDPSYLPRIIDELAGGPGATYPEGADLAIGSRYVRGGGVREWGLGRRLLSRGGSMFGRLVLRLAPHDLTGAFRAWRRETLEAIDWSRVHSGGYVFNIETIYLASRNGARIAEVPIVFVDRRVGVSKMSRRIIVEALFVVLRLRWDELRGRGPGSGRGTPTRGVSGGARLDEHVATPAGGGAETER